MERDLIVLLVEDDPADCKAISDYIKMTKGVKLTGVTNNSEKAFDYIEETFPDAIILDLELHRGSGNGLDFLNRLKSINTFFPNAQYNPYILITTNNISKITHDKARELGADFILSKHQEDYCAESVVGFLKSMKSAILNNQKQREIYIKHADKEDNDLKNSQYIFIIQSELHYVGINPKVLGRKYLIEGIMMAIENPERNITLIIAEKYKKTVASVEQAMHNAIISAWKKSNIEDLIQHYTARINPEKGIPTVSEFIYYYAEKIKNDR